MTRPAVLVVDPDATRRKELCRGLAEHGYEVVPAVGEEEGRRFAEGLGPSVVVAPMGLAGFADALPQEVIFLRADGLPSAELVRRVRLVLLGREIDVEADPEQGALIGDLALVPFLELLRGLARALVTGRVLLDDGEDGEVVLDAGRVMAARAGRARGVKAFCRLGRRDQGTFRVVLEPAGATPATAEPEIGQDVRSLVIQAVEDVVHGAPDPRSRVRVELGPSFFATGFTPRHQEVLAAAQGRPTVAQLLDALSATDGQVLRDLLTLAGLGAVAFEEPAARVRVVTDSTADLPADLARAHGIATVPVLVQVGDRVCRDGVDLTARELYELLEQGAAPRTSPPSPADVLECYRELPPSADLVSLHLSGKLSQTLANARAAAEEELPRRRELARARGDGSGGSDGSDGSDGEPRLEVVDSGSVSLGLGLLALFAARMARRGLGATEIAERLAAMRERVHVLFVVDTLEFLARGGRIDKARALVGGLLGIKPILGVVGGEVVAIDKVRGGRAAHPRIIELLGRRLDPARPVVAGIAHAKAPVWADRLRALVEGRFQVAELIVAEMGPVVGTHAGPGTVGAAVIQPTDDELPLVAPLPEG